MSDNEYENTQDLGSHTYPSAAGDCKKGGYIVINGRPAKVVETSTSKTGKHGHAKSKITAIDIFTGNKLEDVFPSSHNVDVPHVTKTDFDLVNIDDTGFITLCDAEGEYREDLRLTESDFVEDLKADFQKGMDLCVCVIKSMGIEQVVSYREAKK